MLLVSGVSCYASDTSDCGKAFCRLGRWKMRQRSVRASEHFAGRMASMLVLQIGSRIRLVSLVKA